MTGAKSPASPRPVYPFQNVYTKHNITTMLYYINIYIIVGAIVSALALLINGYWVRHDGDEPLTSWHVIIIMFLWPVFLWYLFYYFFIKKDLDK